MSGDPMKLVKFVCAAKAHAGGRSESALTIHEGAWAICPMGGDATGHDWQPSDGLSLTDALRFAPRQQARERAPGGPAQATTPEATTPEAPTTRGKARPR
ncbi:MAG TPA: hypothetical protein VIN69_01415 [Candidatus Limnocylindria bacterium]|jgi:hypothetical protein